MKLVITTLFLAFFSFSAMAQLNIDVENSSTEDVFVDIAKTNSKCAPVCYMSNTIPSGTTPAANWTACSAGAYDYGKIWVGQPGTSNGVYVGLCYTDAASFTIGTTTINVAFTGATSTTDAYLEIY